MIFERRIGRVFQSRSSKVIKKNEFALNWNRERKLPHQLEVITDTELSEVKLQE